MTAPARQRSSGSSSTGSSRTGSSSTGSSSSRASTRSSASKSSSSKSSASKSSGSGRRIAAGAAARKASEEFEQMTRTQVERVVGVRREENGWTVQLEAVELRRTPPTMDVLAMYEVQISSRGQVGGWERVNRYHRSQVEGS